MEAATQPSGSSDRLDYAIVGAGVSGLYTAWRLLEDAKTRQMPMPKIGIFEMGDRTGGRLLTWLPAEGLRAELGGMRFFEQQELVWNLVAQLGFGKRDMTSFWVDGPNLRLLLRGVSTLAAGTDPTARYALPSNLRGQSAGKIIGDTITNVLQAPENWPVIEQLLGGLESDGLPKDREAWDRIKPELTWRGTPLWNVGFWNLLSDIHTAETYQYLVDALGYFSLAGNWNAAEAMEFIALDFTVTLYMSLDRGYSALPDTLAQQAEALGAQIHLNTRLVRFDGQADGSSRLLLAPAGDAAQYTVDAEHLVLAMPRRSLELLAPSAEFDIQGDERLKQLVTTIKPQPAFKLYLFYDERWWEQLGITHGRSISDLPLRQTYYFAPQPWADGEPMPRYGMLLASYNDARAVDYWQGFVPREPVADTLDHAEHLKQGVRDMIAAGLPEGVTPSEDVPDPPPHLHVATPEMLSHVRSQLALLHDIPESEVPEARFGGYGDWGRDPWGGGWNFWDSQVNVLDAMTQIKTPLGADRRVYIVGDAYSGAQGWVEGALTSAEKTIQEHLGVSAPGWLPGDYYLGW